MAFTGADLNAAAAEHGYEEVAVIVDHIAVLPPFPHALSEPQVVFDGTIVARVRPKPMGRAARQPSRVGDPTARYSRRSRV